MCHRAWNMDMSKCNCISEVTDKNNRFPTNTSYIYKIPTIITQKDKQEELELRKGDIRSVFLFKQEYKCSYKPKEA